MKSWWRHGWWRHGLGLVPAWLVFCEWSGVPSQRASYAELAFSLLLAWSCLTNCWLSMAGWVDPPVSSGSPSNRASYAQVFSLLLVSSCVTNSEVVGNLNVTTLPLGHHNNGFVYIEAADAWSALEHLLCHCGLIMITVTVYMDVRSLVVVTGNYVVFKYALHMQMLWPIRPQYLQIQGWLKFWALFFYVFVQVKLWRVMWAPGQLLVPYLLYTIWIDWHMILDSNRRVGVWLLPWRWHILSIPLTTGRGTSAETCGLDDVFPPDDLCSRPEALC